MKSTKWSILTIAFTAVLLSIVGGFIWYVDPYFHYHEALPGKAYELYNSRYQNDGIVRNFQYDTLIIGTSMIANFRTTECDRILGGKSVKVPMYGATFKEVNDNLKRALESNPGIKRVIRCIEHGHYSMDKDYINYDGIPYYLYDNNYFNDCEYILNKEIAVDAANVLIRTANGEKMTTFDDYLRWQGEYEFGKDAVLAKTPRPEMADETVELARDERERAVANVRQNVVETAMAYPDVEFDYFMSPYSIVFWDVEANRLGKLDWYFELFEAVIEEMLTCPNIRLFGFDDMTQITTDLDNYQDSQHYGSDVNSSMLEWFRDGKGLITKDNYKDYLQRLRDFYGSYDYDSIYQ